MPWPGEHGTPDILQLQDEIVDAMLSAERQGWVDPQDLKVMASSVIDRLSLLGLLYN